MPRLHIFKTERETCYAFAEWLTGLVATRLETQDKFTLALCGGDTTKNFFKALVIDYSTRIEWQKVHLFWNDERLVDLADNKSNAGNALRIFVEHLPIPKEQVHIIEVDGSTEEACRRYQHMLELYFRGSEITFDLALLGLGTDGSTLGWYPGTDDYLNGDAWVVPVKREDEVPRVTLTSAVVNRAYLKAFLVTGKGKQEAVANVIKGKYEPEKYTAQLVQTTNHSVHWFLDESASSLLIKASHPS